MATDPIPSDHVRDALQQYHKLIHDMTLHHRYLYTVYSLEAPANDIERSNIANDYEGMKINLVELLGKMYPGNSIEIADSYDTPYPVLRINGMEGWFSLEWPPGFKRLSESERRGTTS